MLLLLMVVVVVVQSVCGGSRLLSDCLPNPPNMYRPIITTFFKTSILYCTVLYLVVYVVYVVIYVVYVDL